MADKRAFGSHKAVGNLEIEPGYAEPTEERDASEKRVARLRLLWGHRRFLARTTALGLAAAALVAFLTPNRYVSTTRLMPPDQDTSSGMRMLAALASRATNGGSSGLSTAAGDVLGLKSSGALFMGILGSRTVEDDLIAKFNLRRLYHDRRWEDARSDLQDNTKLEEDRKSGIITLGVRDKSAQRAAAMADEYVEELNLVVTHLNTSSAHRERVFLEGRLTEVKQDLETAEKDFSDFASKNAALDIPAQGKAMIEAAATLEGQLIAAQTELESLRQIYTDSNVRVRATQARVDELRLQLQKLGGKYDTDDASADRNDQSMYPSIRRLPVLGVNYADLYRRTKIQEAVFETLTQQYELAKVDEAKETPSVKVLDPANVPEKKVSPHRVWIILGGTLLCFLAGIAWIMGATTWKEIDPQDPGKIFAHEVAQTLRLRFSPPSSNGSARTFAQRLFWRRSHKTGNSASEVPDGGR